MLKTAIKKLGLKAQKISYLQTIFRFVLTLTLTLNHHIQFAMSVFHRPWSLSNLPETELLLLHTNDVIPPDLKLSEPTGIITQNSSKSQYNP